MTCILALAAAILSCLSNILSASSGVVDLLLPPPLEPLDREGVLRLAVILLKQKKENSL